MQCMWGATGACARTGRPPTLSTVERNLQRRSRAARAGVAPWEHRQAMWADRFRVHCPNPQNVAGQRRRRRWPAAQFVLTPPPSKSPLSAYSQRTLSILSAYSQHTLSILSACPQHTALAASKNVFRDNSAVGGVQMNPMGLSGARKKFSQKCIFGPMVLLTSS